MDGSRFKLLEDLFNQSVSMPEDARDAWLATLAIDDSLRAELRALIAADAEPQPLTERFDTALAGATAAGRAGVRLGQWRLLREIGAGGAGVVWLAERADAHYQQQVAIKINRAIASGDAAAQLRHERQILATLEHPAIARLLDGGETDDGHPYLVMEYVPGEPLTVACRTRALDMKARLRLVAQIARGVHYAHQRLIIHRDIKPGNILLRDDGRPVLLDFGIAKLFAPGERYALATQPWFTPAYASPEQKRNQPISTATDVYALGLVLCELLSGREPDIADDGRVTAPSRRCQPEAQRALRGDLDAIVARACAPEPERRYTSAEALAEDIERWLRGRPIRARVDTPLYRIGKFVRRHPFGVGFGISAVVVILATAAWLQIERQRAVRAEGRARAEAQAAEAVTEFLIGVFREAEPGAGKSRVLTPVDLLDRGRAVLRGRDDIALATRARINGVLGQIYGFLGEPERSTEALRIAIEDADRAHLDARTRIDLRRQLASALDDRADYPAAEKRFREAAAIAEASQLQGLAIDARGSIGFMQAKQRQHVLADASLRSAIADSAALRGADHPETARLRMYLAEALMLTDRSIEASAESERALRSLRQHLKPDDPELLGLLTTHAAVLRTSGDREGSIKVLKAIIAQREPLLARNSFLLANAYSALGSAYYEQGATRAATEQFVAALDIGRNTLDPNDPSFAIDLNNVGSLYEEQGDYARAEPFLREAWSIYRKRQADEPFQFANVTQNLGRLLMFAGEKDEARQLLEIAIADAAGGDWVLLRMRRQLHLADWERRFGSAVVASSHLDAVRIEALGGPDSLRVGALLRLRGLVAVQLGEVNAARDWLRQAHDHWARTRNPDYVGVGEVALDLAELALGGGDRAGARRHGKEALRILDPVLVAHAPQRARLERVIAAASAE
jgi:tetratricopeptide (TPR) repeat protein